MTLLYIIGIAFAVVAVAIFLIRWARTRKPSFVIPEIFEYHYTSPNGVKIMSVVPLPDYVMLLIENGIGTQIWKSYLQHPEWARFDRLPHYGVILIDPMTVNQDGSPAIFVKGIQSAGTCIGLNDGRPYGPKIVLPHQFDTNWNFQSYLQESARHESEHIRLWTNDRELFNHYTGENDVHPIFP